MPPKMMNAMTKSGTMKSVMKSLSKMKTGGSSSSSSSSSAAVGVNVANSNAIAAITPKEIVFKDFPDFRPNLTPAQIFALGSFGEQGGYWRSIYSGVNKKQYNNMHLEFTFFKPGHKDNKYFPQNRQYMLTGPIPDINPDTGKKGGFKSHNKYGVACGLGLKDWEAKQWIHKDDPYGWVHWYCRFYSGRRTTNGEDQRQISRWKGLASENGRFRNQLINLLKKKGKRYDDNKAHPKIRQTLQHWGYQLTEQDFKAGGGTKELRDAAKAKK